MPPALLRFGPALIVLLAALMYVGTVAWQCSDSHPTVAKRPISEAGALADFKLPMPRPPQAECDAFLHYTPAVSVPLIAKVVSAKNGVLKLENPEGLHEVRLVSATRVVVIGKAKSQAVFMSEINHFNQLARLCNDGTQVYMAPEQREAINLPQAALKPGMVVQVFMDEAVDGGKTQAAGILLIGR